jgi:hypothetical protein
MVASTVTDQSERNVIIALGAIIVVAIVVMALAAKLA